MTPRAKQFMSALAGFIIVILVAAPEARQQSPAFVARGRVGRRSAAHVGRLRRPISTCWSAGPPSSTSAPRSRACR